MKLNKKGFTLIELVVVITIMGILSLGMGSYIRNAMEVWNFVSFRTEMVNDARIVLNRMGNELRQISTTALRNATASLLTYNSSDNTTINSYRYNGPNLFYEVDTNKDGTFENSYNLLNHATNFTFTYYNISGSVTTVLAQIYRMEVNLTVSDSAAVGGSTINLSYGIFPRN